MKVKTFIFLLLLVPQMVFASFQSNQIDQNDGELLKIILPGKFIVKFKAGDNYSAPKTSSANYIANRHNVTSISKPFASAKNLSVKKELNMDNVFLMTTDMNADIEKIVKELSLDPSVEYAEPVYIVPLSSGPNDSLYSEQPYLPQIDADHAWDVATGDSNVIIAVIDGGVDWDHEDLKNAIWNNKNEIPDNGIDDDNNGFIDDIRGWDFVDGAPSFGDYRPYAGEDANDPDNNPMDFDGHGTHVAGIAAAQNNNHIGVASVAGGAKIMPLKVGYLTAGRYGINLDDATAEAFIYAADNGANIVNLSAAGYVSQLIVDAAYYAFKNNVLIVQGAGNYDNMWSDVLASKRWIMSVGAVNQYDKKTTYSSYGKTVKISAPGGEGAGLLSTVVYPSEFWNGNKYDFMSGTSMSTPVVASAAALLKSHKPGMSVMDLFTTLVGTADNIDNLNPDYAGLLGTGRVNVYRALTENVEAEPHFLITKLKINDLSGNSNGKIDPGETVELELTLRNEWSSINNVSFEIISDSDYPIKFSTKNYSADYVGGIMDTARWEKILRIPLSCSNNAISTSKSFAVNISSSNFNQKLEFILSVSPSVLLVEDFRMQTYNDYDDIQPVRDALVKNNISFESVRRFITDMSDSLLKSYKTVIWACDGFMWTELDSTDRRSLKNYMDNGGALLLTSDRIAGASYIYLDPEYDQDFCDNYLRAKWVGAKNVTEVFGVDGDPISDGIDFKIYERHVGVIEPINGSTAIFNDGYGTVPKLLCLKYEGDYNLIFFSFGGFEAIIDTDIRNKLMGKSVRWLSGIRYNLEKNKDTENLTDNIPIQIEFQQNKDKIAKSVLCWRDRSKLNYSYVEMTKKTELVYQVEIPPQNAGTTIEYFIYVETESGKNLLTEKRNFYVGPDNSPPEIAIVKPLSNCVSPKGPAPFNISVALYDNLGIDTASCKIHYWANDNPERYNLLTKNGDGIFGGTFTFGENLKIGDKVNYYFSAKDISAKRNETLSDTFYYFIDTLQIIDDFENGLSFWDTGTGWGVTKKVKNRGDFSITDSPDSNYKNNSNNILQFKMPLDLSTYQYAELSYYTKSTVETNLDSLFVEISKDSKEWEIIFSSSNSSFSFKKQKIDLSNYTGVGNESDYLRFRFKTNETTTADGIYIDDISLVVSENVLTDINLLTSLPKEFELSQNYPNPFNPSTVIKYALPFDSKVVIKIYNVLGQNVRLLKDEIISAGNYEVQFNSASLSSGVYFYRLSAESLDGKQKFSSIKKMILLK